MSETNGIVNAGGQLYCLLSRAAAGVAEPRTDDCRRFVEMVIDATIAEAESRIERAARVTTSNGAAECDESGWRFAAIKAMERLHKGPFPKTPSELNEQIIAAVEMTIDAAKDEIRAELADDPVVRKVEAAFAMPPSNGATAPDPYGTLFAATNELASVRQRLATAEAELADLRSCPPPSKVGAWEAWEAALKEFDATPLMPAPRAIVDAAGVAAELDAIMGGMVAWPQLPSIPACEQLSLAFRRLGELKARLIAGRARHPEPGPAAPPSNGKPAGPSGAGHLAGVDAWHAGKPADEPTIFDHVSGVRVPVAPPHVPTEPEPADETPTAIEVAPDVVKAERLGGWADDVYNGKPYSNISSKPAKLAAREALAEQASREWLAEQGTGRYPDYTERDPWEGGQPWRGRKGALPYRVERPIGFRTKPN